jgi:hypothetical protein
MPIGEGRREVSMEIGKPERTIEITPAEEPVPSEAPVEEPVEAPAEVPA